MTTSLLCATSSSGSPSRSAPRRKVTGPESSSSLKRSAAVRGERDPRLRRVLERQQRNAEDRAHGRAQRLRAKRVGAAGRESDSGPERVRRAQKRADVARIHHVPERERRLPLAPAADRPADRRRSRAPGAAASKARLAAPPRPTHPPRATRPARSRLRAPLPRDPRPRRRRARARRACASERAASARASASGSCET